MHQEEQGSHPPALDTSVIDALRSALPVVADRAVATIVEEVPSYTSAFTGHMGRTIRVAVEQALGGFLTIAGRQGARTPLAPALDGAYQLGRGEARSGRSMEALLAAYRIGARVSWHELSRVALANQIAAAQLAEFAELVFAYIDQLSSASARGHASELESAGRIRQRNLERLARSLLNGSGPDAAVAAAERAEWEIPGALTCVLAPDPQSAQVMTRLDPLALAVPDDVIDVPLGTTALLVPTRQGAGARAALLSSLRGSDAVVGPSVPWLEAPTSLVRALRCQGLALGGLVDADAHLPALVLNADVSARADLRDEVLAPLEDVRAATADKLTETLRAWLLHQGRREAIADALFVHPQTVRYRVAQLREIYGERLDDPEFVLAATVALG